MRLHLNKPGIRALGIAESFSLKGRWSVLAGVVMRSDFVVDGVALGRTSVGGDYATAAIASLHRRLRRNDVNLLMVSGAILSLYNIIEVDELAAKAQVPVVCLTYNESAGIEDSIRRHFDRPEGRLERYRRLGARSPVLLRTGLRVYVRNAGIGDPDARRVLDAFTLQGGVPEPVRIAKLLARSARSLRSGARRT